MSSPRASILGATRKPRARALMKKSAAIIQLRQKRDPRKMQLIIIDDLIGDYEDSAKQRPLGSLAPLSSLEWDAITKVWRVLFHHETAD